MAAAAATALVVVLAACDPTETGTAALVGGFRISETDVQGDARSVLETVERLKGQPPDGQALLRSLLQRRIVNRLVQVEAARVGVEVTQGDVDRLLAESGGRDQLAERFAQAEGQWAPASAVDDAARSFLLQQRIASSLAAGAGQEEQGQALQQALAALAQEIGVTVSPRFGTWNAQTFELSTVEDLSRPAGSPSPSPSASPSSSESPTG